MKVTFGASKQQESIITARDANPLSQFGVLIDQKKEYFSIKKSTNFLSKKSILRIVQ